MKYLYNSFASRLERVFKVDAHYFLKGGFWLSVTQGITIIGGLASSVLFAHYLDATDYGIYRYLIGLSALFAAFSLTGLGQSILQTAAKKYYGFYQETLRTNFVYSLGITIAGGVGGAYYFLNDNYTLAIGCLLIAVTQPIIIAFSNTTTYLQGRGQYKDSSIVQAVKTTVITAASIITILITENILILLAVFLISQLVANYVTHAIYRPKNVEAIPTKIFDKYFSYAKQTSARNVVANIAFRLDTIVVFQQLGATELAIYTVANLIPEQIKGSFKNLASLIIPKYAQHKNLDSLKKNIPRRSLQLLTVAVIVTVAYILIAPILYNILFPKYESVAFYSQIAALSFPAMLAIIPIGALQSQLKDSVLHKINNISSVISIILTLYLTITWGLMGAIVSKLISRYFSLFLSYLYIYK